MAVAETLQTTSDYLFGFGEETVNIFGNDNQTITGDNNTTTINIDKTRNTSEKQEVLPKIANKTVLDDSQVQEKIFGMLSRQTEVLEGILEELKKK